MNGTFANLIVVIRANEPVREASKAAQTFRENGIPCSRMQMHFIRSITGNSTSRHSLAVDLILAFLLGPLEPEAPACACLSYDNERVYMCVAASFVSSFCVCPLK